MFNIRKLTLIGFCSLIVLVLGACSNGEVAERKKAWYPPSATPDASATATVDVSPVVGPDPANPHLIPRPFVNADGSFNRPVEPDLTDHSDEGVRAACEFFMQSREFFFQSHDSDFLERYLAADSETGNGIISNWENIHAWANGSNFHWIEDFKTKVVFDGLPDGTIGCEGTLKAFFEVEQVYKEMSFAVLMSVNSATNELHVNEFGTGEDIQ